MDSIQYILAKIDSYRTDFEAGHAFRVPAWKREAIKRQAQMLILLERLIK